MYKKHFILSLLFCTFIIPLDAHPKFNPTAKFYSAVFAFTYLIIKINPPKDPVHNRFSLRPEHCEVQNKLPSLFQIPAQIIEHGNGDKTSYFNNGNVTSTFKSANTLEFRAANAKRAIYLSLDNSKNN
jgi:hypothetical protein